MPDTTEYKAKKKNFLTQGTSKYFGTIMEERLNI